MSTRVIRVKVRGGRLEPLDELPLAEGSETTVAVEVPDEVRPEHPKTAFRSWNLGLGAREITREDAYDDAH